MQRREFLKVTSCLTCFAALNSGCCKFSDLNSILQIQKSFDLPEEFLKNIKNDKFYYKSKKDLPKKIYLDACSLCQLDCPKCFTRLFEKNAPKDWLGYLKFENFKKFVDDNDFEIIELSNKGEIFLNPELDEIIKYAYKKEIKLTAGVGVNLNTVSGKTLENLVKYKFDKITVSIDGATPETYKIYRRGGDFDTVINNIKIINKFKKQYNSEFPKLTWQFILFGHNEHETDLARKKALDLGMPIFFKDNHEPSYSPVKKIKKDVEKEIKFLQNKRKQINSACKMLFNTPQIDHKGNLLGCCLIQYDNFKENVFKKGLLEALNSPKYIYAKHMITDLSTPPLPGILCSECINYKDIVRHNHPINVSQLPTYK